MPATILSGREAANALLEKLKPKIKKLNPRLVVIQVGDDPASSSYIRQKMNSCQNVGMESEHIHLPETVKFNELMDTVVNLNHDDKVTGFIVQLPLPDHLASKTNNILEAISPAKDIDGFGAVNQGMMMRSKDSEYLCPATPAGIIALLEYYKTDVAGKHAVIVGRSNIVGKPVSFMLLNRNATVTVCHSKTKDLKAITNQADILVAAIGKPKIITADMVKPGAVVIDVGVNRTKEGLIGDTDFENIKEIAAAITPVPGGVGPMTVASLINNCVKAKENSIK